MYVFPAKGVREVDTAGSWDIRLQSNDYSRNQPIAMTCK